MIGKRVAVGGRRIARPPNRVAVVVIEPLGVGKGSSMGRGEKWCVVMAWLELF
jgi:hypothetical protein